MSKKTEKKEPQEEKPKSGFKKLLMISVSSLTLVGTGVGGGFYYSNIMAESGPKQDPNRPKLVKRGDNPPPEEAGDDDKEAPLKEGSVYVESEHIEVDPAKYEVTYYKLPQNFTANLGEGANFVQLGVSLATYYDGKVIMNIKRQMVPLRSAILLVLSEQSPEELATSSGKKKLQKKLTDAINEVLRQKEGFGGIDDVYFTNLVIQ